MYFIKHTTMHKETVRVVHDLVNYTCNIVLYTSNQFELIDTKIILKTDHSFMYYTLAEPPLAPSMRIVLWAQLKI